MPESQNSATEGTASDVKTMVQDMHRQYLEALRHREQQIIQFLAILVPTLGAFLWLLRPVECANGDVSVDPELIAIGAIAAIFLLSVGAVYAVALGYNFRYIVMQMAKIEWREDIRGYALEKWPRTPNDFKTCYLVPPEMIMVFWASFIVGIIGISVAACRHLGGNEPCCWIVLTTLVALLASLLIAPLGYGCKLSEMAGREREWQEECDKHNE